LEGYLKIGVVGSRSLVYKTGAKREALKRLDEIVQTFNPNHEVHLVSGGARGPDTWAEDYASKLGLPITVYHSDWDKYGKSAGFVRNAKIAEEATILVVFHDGLSRGALHTATLCLKKGTPVFFFVYDGKEYHPTNLYEEK
jgi:predicted Rossmann fold nucleotide-binding protein DprA/Smf involved in DNA uptake